MLSTESAAIRVMKRELDKIEKAQRECVDEIGHAKSECRYKYQMLTELSNNFKSSIDYLEKLYQGKEVTA